MQLVSLKERMAFQQQPAARADKGQREADLLEDSFGTHSGSPGDQRPRGAVRGKLIEVSAQAALVTIAFTRAFRRPL